MAGGKKAAKKLTPEEWLEQALVPVEEQPYEVPENWCWTRIKNVAVILNGYAFKSQNYVDKGIRIIRITNVQDGYIEDDKPVFYPFENEVEMKKYMLEAGDLLISLTGNVGRVAFLNNEMLPAALNQRVGCLRFNHSFVNKSFLFYYFLRQEFQDSCIKNSKGSAQLNMSTEWLKSQPVPIPPFNEQQRIAECIESLFAKLDEARGQAQAVLDSFELRRSAVLHKAFSGELTEQWRKQHGKNVSDWHMTCFDKTAEIKSNLVDPADYQDFPHIAPDNIEKKTGVLLAYHTIAEDGVKSGKHRFYAGQILYSKIRPYLSKVIMVDFDGLCSADMYPVDAKENAKYLWYYMLSDEFLRQASNAGSRSVLPKINQKELSKIIVHMTSPEEQQAVVLILDRIFEKERKAQKAAESVIDQIDTMKKAILSRAFRGELGTNDPKEENAENLLLKIFKEKDNNDHRIKDVEKDKIDTKTSQNFKSSLEETIYQFILNNPECTLSEMKNLSGNFSDINKALLYLKQNKKIQINNSKYRVIIQDEDSLSSIQ